MLVNIIYFQRDTYTGTSAGTMAENVSGYKYWERDLYSFRYGTFKENTFSLQIPNRYEYSL